MLDRHYDGVILEDKWGKTYLCSNCLLAYADLGEDCISEVKDLQFGRYFLHDLEPHWNHREIWAKMYQLAKPWQFDLSKLTTFQLRDALIKMFAADEMRVWQLTEGWGAPPEDNGIGEGEYIPAGSADAGNSSASPVPVAKANKPGGGLTEASAQQSKTAGHNPKAGIAENKTVDDIVKDPAARKALYKKHGIEVGPYKKLQQISKEGYQREHFIPHSCFMTRSVAKGESRSKVPIGSSYGDYNEADAITYFVYDAQSEGTEHRTLTDAEVKFARELKNKGEFATVAEWLDHMEQETARTFILENVERAPGVYEARVPDNEAALVAKCIRTDVEDYLVSCGCDMNAPLSNLVGGGGVPDNSNRVDEDI